ncbi:MAG: tetratricopeptide repeat protein, partial [Myxococcales bacterium]
MPGSRSLPLTCLLLSLAAAPVQADDWGLTRPPERRGSDARPRRSGGRVRPPTRRAQEGRDRDEVLRRRYMKVLRRNPLDDFALERLLAIYRTRDGSLDGLAQELLEAGDADADEDEYGRLLILGQVQQARGDLDAAREAYRRAALARPDAPAPLLLSGRLAAHHGEEGRAVELLDQALERTRQAPRREAILRELGQLALDAGDFEAAARRYGELAAMGKRSVYRSSELARALSERGHHARAVQEYARVLEALRGDNRVLPPLLLEMARAQLEAGEPDAALSTLRRARRLAGGAAGIRWAIDALRVEVHRRRGTLAGLAEELSREGGGAFEHQSLLGRVYEELGEHDEALAAHRRALAARPGDVDTRERVVRILTRQGRLQDAIAEYRRLIARAPREPRHVTPLARLLMESGQREEALRLLDRTAARFARDARVQRSLHELYVRWDEPERAARTLQRLARIEPRDPGHLVMLGEQQLAAGQRKRALATWRRILQVTPDRAKGHAALAETYLDHDMPAEALSQWQAAARLQPEQPRHLRGMAEALERLHRVAEAARTWERVLALSKDDRAARREARRRLVRLWAATGELKNRIRALERAFGWPDPGSGGREPDLDAGRFLAEAYRVLGQGRRRLPGDPRFLKRAEQVLQRLTELAPGDVESLLALERSRTSRGDARGAIEVLERLVKADPQSARAYLARMAEHALDLYRDDEAVRYAERAVALNPDDAAAHRRLGDLYRARQQGPRAIESYRRAIELDERAYPVHMQLAELHLSRGEGELAARRLLQVMRGSPDDELVRRATRSLIQLRLGTGGLLELEQDLLPLALGHGRRPVYRELLVELYDAMARPWVEQARTHGPGAEAARERLRALGQRGIKPLLEALSDRDPTQRRIAIELLAHLQNDHAALPLLSVAERGDDTDQRRRALLAAGAVAGDGLSPHFAKILAGPERRLRVAAAWALARIAGPRAVSALRSRVDDPVPAVRGYALLGLARGGAGGARERLEAAVREDRSEWVRAVAALGLGRPGRPAPVATLLAALSAERPDVSTAAVVALGIAQEPEAAGRLSELAFAPEPKLREAVLWALRWSASDEPPVQPKSLPEPGERPRVAPLLRAWLAQRAPADRAAAAGRFDAELL